ncbi:hypothetical protein CAPTEDRAFT_216885 [Capitella teleta]|uniref:G-protein coupled receptors family 1 profile domain-containing protein n=1 Tax=Capitella teleta TaxID=283909 RepID=R7TMZ8_CAPTE|nr:hypothetical protein CAPTEDRAFT_216885 [Capitella teleta]|eukprot:ELT92926.1 hypothetical protein CAPTEDRAFT_216885 [Capitella teleta]
MAFSASRLCVLFVVLLRSTSGQEQLATEVWEDETAGNDIMPTPAPKPAKTPTTPGLIWIPGLPFSIPAGGRTPPPGFLFNLSKRGNFTFPKKQAESALSKAAFQLEKYFNLIVLPLSIVLNVMSLMVYLQPHRRKQSVSVVMSALAVADIFALYLNWSKMFTLWLDFNLQTYSAFFCRSVTFVSYVARSLSSWYILIFTGERLISVKFPLKKVTMVTMSRVRLVLVVTTVLVTISQCYFVMFMERRSTPHMAACGVASKYTALNEKIKFVMREIFGFLLPSFLTGVCNFFIVRLLRVASKKQIGMTGGSSSERKKEADNTSLTIMLVVVSTFSIIVYTPRSISQIIFDGKDKKTILDGAVDRILECMGILNHSCNFLFYCLGGKTFREDFMRMITCQKYKPARSNTITKSQVRSVAERVSANNGSTKKSENGLNAI